MKWQNYLQPAPFSRFIAGQTQCNGNGSGHCGVGGTEFVLSQ